MRRFKTLLLLVVLLGATPCAFAQFSISKVTPEQVEIKVTEDSSKKKIVNLDNNFYSRARYKAERRAIRQERNTLQINASAMFNQTGFTNWYAGGDNVFSTSLAFYFSHKYVKNKFNLQTTFDARYGINRINKENFKNEDAFVFNLSGRTPQLSNIVASSAKGTNHVQTIPSYRTLWRLVPSHRLSVLSIETKRSL